MRGEGRRGRERGATGWRGREGGRGGIKGGGRREAQIERLERRQDDKGTESEIKKREAGEGGWRREEVGGGLVGDLCYSRFCSESQRRVNDARERLRRLHDSSD